MKREFKYYIKDKDVAFKYASGPTEENTKEFHSFNEIILFLDGDAEFISENIHTKIEPNTVILIPKETYHQVIIKGNEEEYHRCTMNFPDMPEIFFQSSERTQQIALLEYDPDFAVLFEKLIKISKNPTSNSKLQLRSILMLILCEISEKNTTIQNLHKQNELLIPVIEYITCNLSKSICVKDVAEANHISASFLAHVFKKEMNISIYQYIIKKRLMLAHRKICEGQLASTAAIECGFNDYSGFYKQYKKLFNRSPSGKDKFKMKIG